MVPGDGGGIGGRPDPNEATQGGGMGGQEEDNLNRGAAPNPPGTLNSFSSLLLWILGGASSEGLNSIFSMFRDTQGQAYVERENPIAHPTDAVADEQ